MTKEKLKPEKKSCGAMKAIKDCKWEVYFYEDGDTLYWVAYTVEKDCCGVDSITTKFTTIFYTESEAKNHWKRFAKINKIKNYVFN